MDCVIGSGPSGVACASALLKRGRHVCLLDAGVRLEPDRARRVASIRAAAKPLSQEDARWLRGEIDVDSNKVPLKFAFGSDYPYRDTTEHLRVSYDGVGIRSSFALGGLSNVWGSALLPYMQQDIADWPISIGDLKPHYEACAALTGLAGESDALNEMLPLYTSTPGHLAESSQAAAMKNSLDRNQVKLRNSGIQYGRSRLAVRTVHEPANSGCIYCGMCLYGCPYGAIYNSGSTIEALKADHRFTYQPDLVVTSVHEMGHHVNVRAYHQQTRKPIEITANRVYMAAGVIGTTAILLRSLGAYDQSVMMKDSQYFLLPMVLTSRVANVQEEELHTLSQLFLEILDPQISSYCVHLQVYSFNDMIAKMVRKKLGPLVRVLEPVAREFDARLMFIQGYLHSALSSKLSVTLRRASNMEKLDVAAVINPNTKQVVRKVVRKLLTNSLRLGAFPVPMMLEMTQPGRGFHSGGTFPMRRNPSQFETDTLGRPLGYNRVHIVDATCLPSIAATTITFTVMANAHRIATEVEALD